MRRGGGNRSFEISSPGTGLLRGGRGQVSWGEREGAGISKDLSLEMRRGGGNRSFEMRRGPGDKSLGVKRRGGPPLLRREGSGTSLLG